MKSSIYVLLISTISLLFHCSRDGEHQNIQPVYHDVPYMQDYSIKFFADDEDLELYKAFADRNGVIQILTSNGLYCPFNGHFQIPGNLQPDKRYRPMPDKKIQFIKDEKNEWIEPMNSSPVLSIKYSQMQKEFLILTRETLCSFSEQKGLKQIVVGNNFTCFDIINAGQNLIIGTSDGYCKLDVSGERIGGVEKKLPWPNLTCVQEINGQLWFGSGKGAFMRRKDSRFNYYYGKRWLPGNVVRHIAAGPNSSVLILTDKGLGQICFKIMTLQDKAHFYEKQVRLQHIRYGINSNVTRLDNHDLSTAENSVADSDNLWTGMYLGSQLFRYLVTGSDEAKLNCYEAFEAMERLHEINGIKGLFGRSFERRGYQEFRKEFRSHVDDYWYEGYQGTTSWRHAENSEWDWRASASSDQTVGQIFALTLIAKYIDDKEWRNRAVELLDELMSYIVENDMCLVDDNGLPSLWT